MHSHTKVSWQDLFTENECAPTWRCQEMKIPPMHLHRGDARWNKAPFRERATELQPRTWFRKFTIDSSTCPDERLAFGSIV